MLRETPTTSELSRCTEVREHNSDNGFFKSVRRHELGHATRLLGRNADKSRPRPKRISMFLFLTTAQTKSIQQNMAVEQLLHGIASCRSAADDANMFLMSQKRSHTSCDRNCSTSFANTMNQCSGPGLSEIHIFSNVPVLVTRS